MQTIRRLYLYFIAAVSLTMLAVGLVNLLDLAASQLWAVLGWTQVVRSGAESLREQVSLFTALVVPALPIWLLHWWLAERAVQQPGPAAESERRSTVRALYLTLVLLVSLLFWVYAAGDLVYAAVASASGAAPAPLLADLPRALATLLIAGGVWLYHLRVRARDRRGGPLDGSAVWLPRFYLYGAAGFGALRLLFGSTELIRLLNDLLLSEGSITRGTAWWTQPLAAGVAQVTLGLLVWGGHWTYALALVERSDWQGQSEQRSVLRRLYLYITAVIGVFMTLWALSLSLENVLRLLLGVPAVTGLALQIRSIVEPPLGVLPFALFWFYQRGQTVVEARRYAEAPLQATVRRVYTYVIAAVGLLFAAAGLAYTIGLLIDVAAGGATYIGSPAELWRERVSRAVALTLVGAGVWLWHWYVAQRQVVEAPGAERGTMTRRLYLFGVLALALVALLGSLAYIIYRIFNVLLGVAPAATLVAEISLSLGLATVAAPLLAYHALTLRDDLAARAEPAVTPRTLTLVLSGPPEADLAAEVSELRRHLPAGYSLTPVRSGSDR
jgi:hypothetical protein